MKDKTVESLAFTINAICASPFVNEYMVGYTSRPGLKRRSGYVRDHGYPHLVILADRLNRQDALALEEALHSFLKFGPEVKATFAYKKYENTRREGSHYKSAGPRLADPDALIHSVYMAWK